MTPDYDAIRTRLLEGFKDHAPEDEKGLAKAEDRLMRSFVHFDDSAITMEYRKPFSRDEVINSLSDKDGKPRNITVLCGDMKEIARGKYDLDVTGHYARPDIFEFKRKQST